MKTWNRIKEPLEEFGLQLGPEEMILGLICVPGIILLAVWIVHFRGPLSLAGCPVRRNRMPFALPFALIGLWILLTALLANDLVTWTFGHAPKDLQTLVQYVIMIGIDLFVIALIAWSGHICFARGIKGLGIHPKTIFQDIPAALINLLAIYPLVLLSIGAVVFLGQKMAGSHFQFQENPALTAISASTTWIQTLVLIISAIVVVPIFEEMIFRGMFQTLLRSFLGRVWPAILITSGLFAVLHPSMHWPAIFVLSCGIGYAYEKSGSLLRGIFVHAFFNGVNVIASIYLQ